MEKTQSADNSTKINHMLELSEDCKAAIMTILPQSITYFLETNEKMEHFI